MREVTAPATLISQPGIKRAGFAHEETVWTTIHAVPVGMTDIAALEAHLVVATHEQFVMATGFGATVPEIAS